jgi:hypothetical protein
MKDLEESGRDIFDAPLRKFSGGTEESYEKYQDNPCPGRDSNRTPPNTSLQLYGYATTLGVRVSGFTHVPHKRSRRRTCASFLVQGWTVWSCACFTTHPKQVRQSHTWGGSLQIRNVNFTATIIFTVTPYVSPFSFPVCKLKYTALKNNATIISCVQYGKVNL